MFLTGQASNVLIAKFAKDVGGVDLSYARWFVAGVVPGVLALIIVPLVLYRVFPPDVRRTPGAAKFAAHELARLGPHEARTSASCSCVFALIAGLWMTTSWHHLNYAVVALVGICVLLLTNVLVVGRRDQRAERLGRVHLVWRAGRRWPRR